MRRFYTPFKPRVPAGTAAGLNTPFYWAKHTPGQQRVVHTQAWNTGRLAAQWWYYGQYALSAIMAGTLCYTAANVISEDTFNLRNIAPFYEAKNGSKFRFEDFKSWEQLVFAFSESYASHLPPLSADEIRREKERAEYAIYALKTTDHAVFLEFVNSLAQRGLLASQPSLFNQLTDICTRLSKVDVLRKLNKINPALTKLNKEANSLLTHPHADEIQRLTEQFITGPGSMKDDGANAFLQSTYYAELEDAYHDFLTAQCIDENASNSEMWSQQFLSYLQNVNRVHDRYSHDQLAIITEFSHDSLDKTADEQFVFFADKLKRKMHNEQSTTIEGTFLFAGSHFSCGRLRLEKDANGEIAAKLVCIDGKGADWGQTCYKYYFTLNDFFNGKLDVYISEENIQKAKTGCSFIAVQQFYYLLHAPLYIQQGDLFKYAKDHTTDRASLVKIDENGVVTTIIDAKTTRLPAALCTLRQVTDEKHVREDVLIRYDENQLKIGSELPERKETQNKAVKVDGRCSALTDLQKRADEYRAPSSPRAKDDSTLADMVTGYFGRQPNGKPANLGTEHFSFYMGTTVVSSALRNGLFSGSNKTTSLNPENSYILSSLKKPR